MVSFSQFLEMAGYRNKRGCNYWGDAGSGVLPFAQDTKKFLVNHRGADVNEGGTFGIYGGGIFLGRLTPPLDDVSQLIGTDIPKESAIRELREETGYSGPIQLSEIYVYKDNKTNYKGEPCDFYYWNYIGIVPSEFPVNPAGRHRWEEGGKSGWLTFNELVELQPKHFGLKAVLDHAGHLLQRMA